MNRILTAMVIVGMLAGCAAAEPDPTEHGDPQVLAHIAQETDCDALQRVFDNNEAWSQRRHTEGETADEALAHMQAVIDRQETLDCPQARA